MSLVAHWKLDGDAKDSVGGYDGYPQSPVYGSGKIGDCWDNTADNANGIELIRHDDFTEYEAYYSFSFWFKSTSTNSGYTSERILSRDASEYPTIMIDQTQSGNQNLKVSNAASPGSYAVNEWHHVVMTIDVGSNESQVFVDGSLEATGGVNVSTAARPYVIGGNTEGDGDGLGGQFIGKIDDVRLYDHILSAKEVKKLSQAKMLHYKFDNFAEPTENHVSPSNRYPKTPKTETNGYGFLNQRFSISDLGLSDGDKITGSMKMKVDQARKDAGGSVRFYYWHSSDSDGWMGPSSSTGYNTTSFKRVTKTATIDTSNGQQYINFGVYHYPNGNDTGTSYAKQFQVETKDHATPFVDGAREGVVSDNSGYKNHAELNQHSPKWTESSTMGSGAYHYDNKELDGSTFQHIGSTNPVYVPDKFTLTHWVKGDSAGQPADNIYPVGWDRLCNAGPNSSGNERSGLIYYKDDGSGYETSYWGNQGLYDNNWHLYTITYNNSTKNVRLYVDGEKVGSDITAHSMRDVNTYRTFYVGAAWSRGYGGHDGKIDDVRVYATELSAEDIAELYHQRASIDSGGNFHTHEVKEPDERTVIVDSTYSVNSQTYNVLANHTPEDTDYSEWVESDDTLGNIYLEGWVYLTNSSWYPTTFEFTKNNNDKGVYAYFQNGVDSWQQGWNYVFVKADNWSNVSNTPWSNMDRLQLYRNGANSGDSSESIRFKNIRLKKYPDNEPVDDMSLQDGGTLRTNSISEVGPGAESLVGWWPLDGDTRDYAGSANGTNNGASLTSGLGQSAYYFDGTDDMIKIGEKDELNPKNSGFSYSTWVKGPNQSSSYRRLLQKGRAHQHGYGFWPYDNSSIRSIGTNSSGNREFQHYLPVLDGSWHHIMTVINRDGGEVLHYLDGKVDATESVSTSGDISPTGGAYDGLRLGAEGQTRYNSEATIQDVRVYNRALTTEEVETLYNLTDPRENQRVIQSENGEVYTKNEFNETL